VRKVFMNIYMLVDPFHILQFMAAELCGMDGRGRCGRSQIRLLWAQYQHCVINIIMCSVLISALVTDHLLFA